ncbi:MAG: glycine--tRNA ligase subunit beta, partial [Pseudomonadota bacterium]
KLDTLVGFWAIDEKPTGSKDPFALRRAALGVVRIEQQNELRLNLRYFIEWLFREIWKREYLEVAEIIDHLQWFLSERLAISIRDQGGRYDYVEAALSIEGGQLGGAIHIRITRRVEALTAFLATEDGANLLAGYKRAANILKAEEKKDGEGAFADDADPALMTDDLERALHSALTKAEPKLDRALGEENFEDAMKTLADLRAPMDAFFEGLMVNDDDPKVRENRLRLLGQIRSALHRVADFSKIEG